MRTTLRNAASAIALPITTEAMIADRPKKDASGPGGMPGGGMSDMDF